MLGMHGILGLLWLIFRKPLNYDEHQMVYKKSHPVGQKKMYRTNKMQATVLYNIVSIIFLHKVNSNILSRKSLFMIIYVERLGK